MLTGWARLGPESESRNVAALGEFNNDGIVASFIRIVGGQLAAKAARFHANDGIHAGIVGRVAIEYFHRQHGFFDLIGFACQLLFDNEFEETAEAFGITKVRAAEDAV